MDKDNIQELAKYTACDVADILLKLGVPGAGFLRDIGPVHPDTNPTRPIVAPASTFLMIPKASPSFPTRPFVASALPPQGTQKGQFSDLTRKDTIVFIQQPAGQSCAVLGGHHATRMKMLGAKAVIVDGRVRDLQQLRELSSPSYDEDADGKGEGVFPVWSKGTSVIGAGAETKFHAEEVPLVIGGLRVEPGDVVVLDPRERGVVVVPKNKVGEVLRLLEEHVQKEDNVAAAINGGMSVSDAFKTFR